MGFDEAVDERREATLEFARVCLAEADCIGRVRRRAAERQNGQDEDGYRRPPGCSETQRE
jgi:hypothetical protein